MLNERSPFETSTQPGATRSNAPASLTDTNFLFTRQALKLVGAAFTVTNSNGSVALYADQKAFKLKEDFRIYNSKDKAVEVMRIAARSILDFSAAYDVFDSATNSKIGTLKRSGMKSMVRDEWQILDAQDREMGKIEEDSMVLALARRFVKLIALLVPQKYTISLGNRVVGQFAQTFNPFIMKIEADFSADPTGILDRRLALAAGVLMCAIEGKQG